jgi:hypothetical protein
MDVSLIVRPHSEYTHRLPLGKNLVDKAIVKIDASRVGASKVTDELLQGRQILKGVYL